MRAFETLRMVLQASRSVAAPEIEAVLGVEDCNFRVVQSRSHRRIEQRVARHFAARSSSKGTNDSDCNASTSSAARTSMLTPRILAQLDSGAVR
jgi:hypothetical protein